MTCPTCNDSEKIRVPVWVDGLADFSTRTCPTCRRAGPGFWSKGHVLRAAHQPMIMWDGDMHAAPIPIPYFPDQKWWSNRAAELAVIAEQVNREWFERPAIIEILEGAERSMLECMHIELQRLRMKIQGT